MANLESDNPEVIIARDNYSRRETLTALSMAMGVMIELPKFKRSNKFTLKTPGRDPEGRGTEVGEFNFTRLTFQQGAELYAKLGGPKPSYFLGS